MTEPRLQESERVADVIARLRSTDGMVCPIHGAAHVGITVCGECGAALAWPTDESEA